MVQSWCLHVWTGWSSKDEAAFFFFRKNTRLVMRESQHIRLSLHSRCRYLLQQQWLKLYAWLQWEGCYMFAVGSVDRNHSKPVTQIWFQILRKKKVAQEEGLLVFCWWGTWPPCFLCFPHFLFNKEKGVTRWCSGTTKPGCFTSCVCGCLKSMLFVKLA